MVTPHIVEPIPDDGKQQTDMKILRAGTMNLGFIAVNHEFAETIGKKEKEEKGEKEEWGN